MVVSYLYGYNGHGDRHRIGIRYGEIWRMEQREAIHPDAYLFRLSGVCWLSVHFGSFRFRFFDLHKKIF